MKHPGSSLVAIAAIATSLLAGPTRARADGGGAEAAFERLKSLAGKWQGVTSSDPNSTIEVNYKVTAAGSAVVETQFANTPHEMVSVYHLDRGQLVMTHYCAVGNQPRLRFDPNRSSVDEVYFDFEGGSNVDPSRDLHIHSGKLRWNGEDAIASEWVAYKDGRPHDTTKFSLKRQNK